MFESLVKKCELERRISCLGLQKEDAIRHANFEGAMEVRNQIDALKEELKISAQAAVSLAELDQILNLLQALISQVALGDFLQVMAQDQFKNLRPLVGYLFPDLKILFEKS